MVEIRGELSGWAIRANARVHEERKSLNSENGELRNAYVKDLKLRIYQKCAAF